MVTATVVTELKANLKHYIEMAVSGDSVIITRPKKENAVLIGEQEYNELLKLKANSEYLAKLDKSIEQAKQGKVVEKTMAELEAMEDE